MTKAAYRGRELEAAPNAKQSATPRELICIAKGRDDRWEAICLDLDIAVAGKSFDDVQQILRGAIISYFADAQKEREPVRSQLLHRRVPFWARLRWTWPFVLAVLFGRKQQDAKATCEFPVTCPA
jgi:hypothetical protein